MSKTEITLQEIKSALKNSEFVFYYQPKVSMITGNLVGAEALIRWQKTDGPIIPPSEFLPLAESSGFISNITRAMFQKLIIDMSIFSDLGEDFTVSINASTKDFNDSTFIDHVRQAIKDKQVDPSKIEVELTESSLLEKNSAINGNFLALIDMGVSLVMDDFGTGFSSIDMLSILPFSTIKLDYGVVSRMEFSEKNRTVVESSIRMGHQLGLNIVAEGIENEKVYLTLQNLGCTIAQGYWISRPLPLFEFLKFVKLKQRWPSTAIGLLYMAQLDHIHWRKSIIDGVFSVTNQNNGNIHFVDRPASDCKSCMLGKWYYGAGQVFSGTHAFDALEEPHHQLHELGNLLIAKMENKDSKEELVEMMRELSRLSGIVIKLLQDIEHEAL